MSSMQTSPKHLDTHTWRALLEAQVEDPSLVHHVAQGCSVCDDFLAAHVDDLDGAVDRVLLSMGPVREAPLDQVGWMRLRRRLEAGQGRMRRLGTAMALVAGLVVVVGVTLAFQPGRQPLWDGLKRSGSLGPTLQLSAARRQPDQSFQRLDDGARLTSRSVLILRATSSIDGPARVYLQRASQAPVEVGEVALQAGTHELQTDAGLLGVTLDGERGAVKVWVVVGEVPFSGVLALEAISSQGSRELAAASVSVQVE